ncbi:hypothetical protein BC829DRAFT_380224 [Chytridium lagenaria]|nr:hypothetical protein BC829DRAFT_380224 [Chytridium lagenaria]
MTLTPKNIYSTTHHQGENIMLSFYVLMEPWRLCAGLALRRAVIIVFPSCVIFVLLKIVFQSSVIDRRDGSQMFPWKEDVVLFGFLSFFLLRLGFIMNFNAEPLGSSQVSGNSTFGTHSPCMALEIYTRTTRLSFCDCIQLPTPHVLLDIFSYDVSDSFNIYH